MAAGVLPSVTVPASTSYASAADASLANIYCNDTLGDCVIAGAAHVRGVTSGNSGKLVMFTPEQIVAQYSAIGGYNPAAPNTDQGCDEQTALNYWETTGFPDGVKLVNAVAVDATNEVEVRLALYLFENLYFGVGLPDAWVNPFPSGPGFVWDVSGDSDPNNGHCFVAVDLLPSGVVIDTWGMLGTLTEPAIAAYAVPAAGGQLFALLSPDTVSAISGKSPAGYDTATLTQFLSEFNAQP